MTALPTDLLAHGRIRAGAVKARLVSAAELHDLRDAFLFARVAGFGALVPLLMRLPLPHLARLIVRPARRRPPGHDEVEQIARVVALGPRVAGPLVRPGCLTRGVTLFWFLRRAGLDVELRFGVNPASPTASGEPDGHCWLTLDEEPFLEKVDPRPRFTELYRLPLARP